MSTEKEDKWLDELISQSIDTSEPRFDPEEWKTKHPDAFQSILSRRSKPASSDQPDFLRRIFARPLAGLAAAAAVIIVMTGLLLTRDKPMPDGPDPELPNIARSPTKIVSMISLRTAYQTGGWDALDQQFKETLDTFGPGPSSISVQQLLEGLNES